MSFGSLPSVLGNGGGVAISVIGGTGLFADGTAAAPSISFAADSDLGVYRISTNVLGFACGGVGSWQMYNSGGTNYLQSSGTNGLYTKPAGEVGLYAGGTNQNITLLPSGTGGVLIGGGTFFPYTTGALALNLNATSSAQSEIKLTNSTTGNGAVAGMLLSCDGNNGYLWNGQATGTLNFGTANALRATFTANGRFLLGTTTDSGALLQIGTNTTTSAGGMVFGTDTTIYRSAAGIIRFGGTQVTAGFDMGSAGYFGITNASGGNCDIRLLSAGSTELRTNGVLALTLDAAQNATFAAAIQTVSVVGFGVTALSSTFVGIGAGTTGRSSLRIPHGVAPTAPVDGDMWTTTAGAFIRINGVTKTFTLI